MHNSLFISLALFITIIYAGEKDISFLIDIKAGSFQPKIESYDEIYPNVNLMKTAGVGIGYSNGFLIARYRHFNDVGKSIVRGIEVEGKAEWQERIASIGIRSIEKPFFLDIAYLWGSVKETISTQNPQLEALTASINSTDNRGYSIAIGVLFPLVSKVNLNIEAEYLYLPITLDKVDKKFQCGGSHFSAGITIIL